MASRSKQNSSDSKLSKSSELETDNMNLKDLKMAACARTAANKDSKEGTTGQDNEEGDQQEEVVDHDSKKGMTNQNSDEGISNQENEEGDSNEAMSESDSDSDSENETLANLIAVKKTRCPSGISYSSKCDYQGFDSPLRFVVGRGHVLATATGLKSLPQELRETPLNTGNDVLNEMD